MRNILFVQVDYCPEDLKKYIPYILYFLSNITLFTNFVILFLPFFEINVQILSDEENFVLKFIDFIYSYDARMSETGKKFVFEFFFFR